MLPNLSEISKKLPAAVRINAPLINGEQYLRGLPFRAEGPYSSGYGTPLYALARREDILAAYRSARGRSRAEIALAIGAISEDTFNSSWGI